MEIYFMAETKASVPLGHPSSSFIEIPYRDEGNGGGAFYDHFTIQEISHRETRISVPQHMTTTALRSYITSGTALKLPFGEDTADGKKVPRLVQETDRMGLLVITGHARETENKRPQILQQRTAHERQLLQRAMNQGRPILGICAGTWQIWTFFGGGLRSVKDHAWERMPAITSRGTIGYNTQMHRVVISASSMLAGAITDFRRYARSKPSVAQDGAGTSAQRPELKLLDAIHPAVELIVNSVHWQAPDQNIVPRAIGGRSLLMISGKAKRDDHVAPKRSKSVGEAFKSPDSDTVEAVEQEHGAPLLAVQWHPEAYNNDGIENSAQNRSLVTYMVKAGDAFCAKRRMLDSFGDEFEDVLSRLKAIKL